MTGAPLAQRQGVASPLALEPSTHRATTLTWRTPIRKPLRCHPCDLPRPGPDPPRDSRRRSRRYRALASTGALRSPSSAAPGELDPLESPSPRAHRVALAAFVFRAARRLVRHRRLPAAPGSAPALRRVRNSCSAPSGRPPLDSARARLRAAPTRVCAAPIAEPAPQARSHRLRPLGLVVRAPPARPLARDGPEHRP